MSNWPAGPVIYEINTAAWLNQLTEQCDTTITLGIVPQFELERLAALQVDGLWLMGVWQRSPASQAIAQMDQGLQSEYRRALPDCTVIYEINTAAWLNQLTEQCDTTITLGIVPQFELERLGYD